MHESRHGAPVRRAFYAPMVLVAAAGGGGASAQAPLPFAAPASITAYTATGAVGLLDANRDGSLDAIVPGVFVGTMLTTIDEHGAALATNVAGPMLNTPSGSAAIALVRALGGGDVDADGREDLVTISSLGSLHLHRNLGATGLGSSNFAPDQLVDDFSSWLPASPPFVIYSFPCLEVVDLDDDGDQDLLVGGGVVDRWSGAAGPGFVACYRGDGLGGFTAQHFPVAGNVVDVEWADVDGDGERDHIVALIESGSVGAFLYELVHLQLQPGGFAAVGAPQIVGPGRCTALEVADVSGDGLPDYVLAELMSGGGAPSSAVYYYLGNGLGQVSPSGWGVWSLPAPTGAVGDYAPALQVADFDRDGHVDVALLRGSMLAAATTAVAAPLGAAELLVAMGPGALASAPVAVALPGSVDYSGVHSAAFPQLPLVAEPDYLRCFDLGRDGSADLLVSGVRTTSPTAPMCLVTLRNLTPPQLGDMRLEKVGEPSGGLPQAAARIGFDGGRARPGNSAFTCTIQNVRGGCLVGLMWGDYAQQDLATVFGFQLHLAPTHYGYPAITSGSQAADGFYAYPLPIPASPALIGDAGYFQYNYYDHTTGTFGGTQATGLWIGS